MELEEIYEKLLLAIYEAKGERILKSQVLEDENLYGSNYLEDLDALVQLEFVEYDKKDEAYYLTTEGYEKVTDLLEVVRLEALMTPAQREEAAKLQMRTKIISTCLFLFLLFGAYSIINGIRSDFSNDLIKKGLPKEVIDSLVEEMKHIKDSLQQVNEINENDKN